MPRFPNTYCSQCGGEFGPGDAGYSHCHQHGRVPDEPDDEDESEVIERAVMDMEAGPLFSLAFFLAPWAVFWMLVTP